MTYAERLAEFVKVTGSKPGEMNKRPITESINDLAYQIGEHGGKPDHMFAGGDAPFVPPGEMNKPVTPGGLYENADYSAIDARADAMSPEAKAAFISRVSLEPPRQSAGPGRCNRFARAAALGDPTPCKLPANHEGPHEP